MGLRTRHEWFAFANSEDRPDDIPRHPDGAYRRSWLGWEDWLGKNEFRSFDEARAFARSLKLQSRQEWVEFAKSDTCPRDVPVYPDASYRGEWSGWGDWLGYYSRWTHRNVVGFLESLKDVVNDLSEADLYLILCRSGMLGRRWNLRYPKLLRNLIHARTKEDLQNAISQVTASVAADGSADETAQELEPSINAQPEVSLEELQEQESSRSVRLPCLESLETLDRLVDAGLTRNEDILDFMVDSRVSFLWKQVIEKRPGFSVEAISRLDGGLYTQMTRDRFLKQHKGALDVAVPEEYSFSHDGKPLPPNLMQRLTAYRLLTEKRIGNWSGVGAGKTLAAIFSAGVIGARLTVIVAANATMKGWEREILRVFPNAVVCRKEFRSFRPDPTRPTYLVVNYESFQQTWSEGAVNALVDSHTIDFIVLDEIQLVKQRVSLPEPKKRRKLVSRLVQHAANHNRHLHVLGMSATPVVNNLFEGRKLLELVKGYPFPDIGTRSTIGNAIALHSQLIRHGIRYCPSYEEIDLDTRHPSVDGEFLIPKLSQLQPRDVLGMEQLMLDAKLRVLRQWLRRGTMIYTQFVTGMEERITQAVRGAGFSVGVYTGNNKEGLPAFVKNKVDILVGSSPVGTGVNELQYVCNRLIFLSLPWSNADYQQIVGRLHRQGSVFAKVEVIIPIVTLREERVGQWSWDDERKRIIEWKQTLADAALDGTLPRRKLPSPQEMQTRSLVALQEWIRRVKKKAPQEDAAPGDSSSDSPSRP